MRVLQMDAGREMRGGQWQVLRLIQGLAAEGVDSTLLARPHAPLFEAARRAGWRVEPIGVARAIQLAASHDLIHAHDARAHTLAAFVPSRPLIVARRVAFPVRSKWKYGRARRFIAVSEFVKRVLVAGGVPAEKISVVYDGVPLLPASQGTAILAPANADDPKKGAALAVAAARMAGVTLEFAADLERDLRNAAILVYLTHSEGLGSGALLAMSAGVAVIASKIDGLNEVIRNEVDGLLVENRAEEIAQAIRALAGNPDRARALGSAGRESVREQFTVERMVRRTIDVYRGELSTNGRTEGVE